MTNDARKRFCGNGCGRPRDRKGQRYCKACHAAYMVGWRLRRAARESRYAESVDRLREELDAFRAEGTR